MSVIDHLTLLIVIFSLIATYLNIHKKPICFKIWLVTNTLWVGYDIYKAVYWQALLFAIYAGLAIYGIIKWKEVKG
jgi:nicotinamide riboside transporter PnuC